jgi:hypothetical protein
VGSYNSLDVIRSGSTLMIGIAYHNVSAGGMKYLLRTCPASGIQNGCTTSIETITQGAADLGMGISLVLNPSGGAHIAYHGLDPDPSKGYFLGYAKQVNGSGSGCLGDYREKWNCGVVDRGTGVNSASLDIDFSPNSGFAYISYYDAAGGNLKLAEENGSAWCGDVQGWRCEVIDGASGSDVGKFSDLNTDSAGAVRMAYYDAGGYLKYASPVGAGLGNCGESGEYQCDRIDAMSLGLEPRMLSLAMLNETTPVIAYYSFNPNTLESRLNVAKPAGSLLGNCGPEIPIYTWLCAKLSTAALNDKTGLWPSVGVNGKGFISIAYIRISDYTQGNGTLALGYEGYPVFLPMLIR